MTTGLTRSPAAQQSIQSALHQPVDTLNGIGKQTAIRLNNLGIQRILDLLFHLPRRYEDRTRILPLGTVSPGLPVLICGTIESVDVLYRGKRSFRCVLSDATGNISLRFFHFSMQQVSRLQPGVILSCFGEVRYSNFGYEMVHPEYKILSTFDQAITENHLTPVYPLVEGIRQKSIRNAIMQALAVLKQHTDSLPEWIPEKILKQMHLPKLHQALFDLHSPFDVTIIDGLQQGNAPALKRLAFEELLAHQLSQFKTRQDINTYQAPEFSNIDANRNTLQQSLPFKLTQAQQRVISQIAQDISENKPMLRLIQGDVGCGKTIVAAFAAFMAMNSGYQTAIMAPTELLAEQLFANFNQWLTPWKPSIHLLTGQIKGQQRKQRLEEIASGSTLIVIGTHAIFQDSVAYKQLGMIIIDEQHRFGVNQRLALKKKSNNGTRPHQLVMTATPIPRTLAMLNYSELDLSIIDELPPGRKPITTRVIPAHRRQEIIDRISSWVAEGKQSYWVCTLIEESEMLQNQAAEQTFEFLTQALPNIRIALVHGRLKAAEKEKCMLAFKRHEIDLLVATTVIEVGVDVPNASLIVIENPERLGLAQLHQLRGRVGRGQSESFCLLLYQSPLSEITKQRLSIFRNSSDGFEIAEQDLFIRGPGEMLGTRQTGQIQFKIADIARDKDLIEKVQAAAQEISSHHPESVNPLIERWLGNTSDYAQV